MGYYAGVTQALLEKKVLVSAGCSAWWLRQAVAALLLLLLCVMLCLASSQ
jgi:hypothetical protein